MAVQTNRYYSVETYIIRGAITITRHSDVDKTEPNPIIKVDNKQVAIVEYKDNDIVTISHRV